MHKNTDFHIEQTRLNDTYRKLNSGNDFSSYINEQENQSPTYWSFLKLRIGFSILFLFFLIACFKTCLLYTSITRGVSYAPLQGLALW